MSSAQESGALALADANSKHAHVSTATKRTKNPLNATIRNPFPFMILEVHIYNGVASAMSGNAHRVAINIH